MLIVKIFICDACKKPFLDRKQCGKHSIKCKKISHRLEDLANNIEPMRQSWPQIRSWIFDMERNGLPVCPFEVFNIIDELKKKNKRIGYKRNTVHALRKLALEYRMKGK